MSRATSSARSDAPAKVLMRPHIRYYDDHVTIRVPTGQWNESLQQLAASANVASDPTAVAELIASERSQPATNQGTATAAHPAWQSDPRDAIPLTYCNNTRRIIALIGFLVSSTTILGVQLAALADLVPGFQALPISARTDSYDEAKFRENNLVSIGFFGSFFICMGGMFLCLMIDQANDR